MRCINVISIFEIFLGNGRSPQICRCLLGCCTGNGPCVGGGFIGLLSATFLYDLKIFRALRGAASFNWKFCTVRRNRTSNRPDHFCHFFSMQSFIGAHDRPSEIEPSDCCEGIFERFVCIERSNCVIDIDTCARKCETSPIKTIRLDKRHTGNTHSIGCFHFTAEDFPLRSSEFEYRFSLCLCVCVCVCESNGTSLDQQIHEYNENRLKYVA